jgi:dimethylargininase
MRIAITRPVPESLSCCELTHLARVPIDYRRASSQHDLYEEALRSLGCTVRHAPAAHDLPDSVFVEDVAVVLDDVAIVTRPGAESRRPECTGVAAILEEYRPLRAVEPPGTVDGGDVLRLGTTLYVGISTRTNPGGADQLRHLASPFGYRIEPIETAACLHLKSAVTAVDSHRVLANPEWIDVEIFRRDGIDVVAVDPLEPHAANVLRLGHILIAAASHVRTIAMLQARGYDVCPVDVSELAKAEAGVTCCSLIVE